MITYEIIQKRIVENLGFRAKSKRVIYKNTSIIYFHLLKSAPYKYAWDCKTGPL